MKQYFLNKSCLFSVISALFLVLMVLITLESTRYFNDQSRESYAVSLDMIDQRMNSLFYEINNFPRYPGNDMLFLSHLSNIKQYNLKALENDLLAFIKENTAYAKLAYVDADGQTLAAVKFDGKEYLVASAEKQPNSKDTDWFKKIISLGPGEVFVSHLNPDQAADPTPIIRYGTPVYTSQGTLQGLIISCVNANYFLEDIRQSQRKGEEVYLIDNTGQYLANPDKNKEFGLIGGKQANFKSDYPAAFEKIVNVPDKRMLEIGDRVFSFRYIYPTASSFAIYKGSPGDYFWVMVSIVNKHDLEKQTTEASKQNFLFLAFSGATLAAVYLLIYLLVFKVKAKAGDE